MYEVLGKAEIDESKFSTTYSYSHDELDRTTTAYGLVNYKAVMDSKGWRADFEPNSEPSGWFIGKKSNNKKVSVKLPNGKIYNGYFYNRSHLIADSLGGRSYKYNVVTGTRQQNVGNNGDGGMQYIEKKVVDYVLKTKNNVYYEVTPVYNGNELVPRYVIVNAEDFQKVTVNSNINELIKSVTGEQIENIDEAVTGEKVKPKEKVSGKITSIKTQVVDGTTIYYLKINDKIYKIEANKNTLDKLPFLEVEQTISAETDENNFLSNINFE